MMPFPMEMSRMESFRAWSEVAATTMSAPSMYSPAVAGSTFERITSSAMSLSSGRTASATTLMRKPSKC